MTSIAAQTVGMIAIDNGASSATGPVYTPIRDEIREFASALWASAIDR